MNLFKKKIQLFCVSNIMVSLVGLNITSASYTYKEEQNALVYVSEEVEPEEVEPLSHNGEENNFVADVKPVENVVVQKEVTGTRTYVPARYSEVTGQAVIDYAMRYLGLRYVSAGNSLSTGTDCSGFTKLIYSEFGVYLPRTVSGQMYAGSYVRKDDLRKGDIVIYGNGGGYATHVAMYIGNGQVIHESNHRDGVKISSLYMMQYITARRVINDTAISIVERQIEEANKEKEEETTLETDKNEKVEENEDKIDEDNDLNNEKETISSSEVNENSVMDSSSNDGMDTITKDNNESADNIKNQENVSQEEKKEEKKEEKSIISEKSTNSIENNLSNELINDNEKESKQE